MLFAKLFGARRDDDDEPSARPVPPVGVRSGSPASPGPSTSTTHPAPKTPEQASAFPADRKQTPAGFDPYNSGAFKKSNAWERVNRR